MDFPVEAIVHLNSFPNKREVRQILKSHGFTLTDLSSDQVRVAGRFLQLKAAKASLEQLLNSHTNTNIAAISSSPVPMVSSGAVSKHYANNSSDGNRSQLGSQNKPHRASPSSPTASSWWVSDSPNNHPASPEYRTSSSPRPDQRGSIKPGRESFVVDGDAFKYANRLRKNDIDNILVCHNVKMEVSPVGDSFDVTLLGKSASIAGGKLQSLLNDLSTSLRTQEVPLKDMDREGRALYEKIQKNNNIYKSVLVHKMSDKLHLVGASGESYELKQKLLGRQVDRPGLTGSSMHNNSRGGGRSLSPGRAAGAQGGARGRQSQSVWPEQTHADWPNGRVQEPEDKRTPSKLSKKGVSQILKKTFNLKK